MPFICLPWGWVTPFSMSLIALFLGICLLDFVLCAKLELRKTRWGDLRMYRWLFIKDIASAWIRDLIEKQRAVKLAFSELAAGVYFHVCKICAVDLGNDERWRNITEAHLVCLVTFSHSSHFITTTASSNFQCALKIPPPPFFCSAWLRRLLCRWECKN